MLVGRDRELSELEAALGRAASASGALYLLVGEPGIGKTSLAAAVAGAARARGTRGSWGHCWEAGGAPAFWPWREAFEGLGIGFPDAATIAASDPAEARFALFREAAGALGQKAAREPLLIVLEDLHAADRSTLLLLEFVATQLRALPILVIGTYRDLEASLRADASDVIARVSRLGRTLQLARLGEAEVAALVREAIVDADDGLAASVFATTHGNPLFVDEIVREVRARGAATGMPIPLGVREIIRQRLGLVSDDVRRVLEAGAVLGVEFGSTELARTIASATAVLDDATRSGLVTARGDRIRFSHALYREALYHDLPRARRQALHRDAARALAATGAPLAETAHHLLESGPDAAVDAIDHAVRAAGLALDVFAFEDAVALLERARLAIPAGALETTLRARILIALGEARIRSGDPAGRALCVEAAEIARAANDAMLLALAGLAYGSMLMIGGVDPILVGLLEDSLERLGTAESPLRARVMSRLSGARQPSPPALRQRDVELALAAIAMARRCSDRRELLGVLHSAAGALMGVTNPSVRLPFAREQERLAEELGDATRLLHARAYAAMHLLEMADFASYAQLATSYEELAARIGPDATPWRVPLMRSMIALSTDQFDESERCQDEARRIESVRPRARRAQAFHRIGFLRASERHAELRASIPALRGLWLEMQYGVMLAEPRVASVLARIGATEEVRAIISALPAAAFGEEINSMPLAEAVWLTGDVAQAKLLIPVIARYDDWWSSYWLDSEIIEAPASRLHAYLSAISGDWDAADRLFARALAAVEGVGKRSMAARMKFELGDLLARADRDPDRARALLAEARASANAIGLPELVALIDRRHPAGSAQPRTQTAPSFSMVLEGEYFAVPTSRGPLRFKATRGMQYLAVLVERPDIDVHVLELAGSSDADRGDAGEVLDSKGFQAYRARLEALRDVAEDAEAIGDADRAERARSEMEAIAGELAKATGRGGKPRRAESAVDRARSAVQRRIKDAIDRVAEQDRELGSWLRRVVHTGNYCSYRPAD